MAKDEVKPLRAMSIKEIMGFAGQGEGVAKAGFLELAKTGQGRNCAVISGDVRTYGMKPGKFGEQFFVLGIFLGRNNLTGQLFRSTKLWFPNKSSAEEVVSIFKEEKSRNADAVVGFTYEISIEQDASTPTGYTYITAPEATPEAISREAELLGRMKALPAPKAKAKAA